jgi:hypothetical protein
MAGSLTDAAELEFLRILTGGVLPTPIYTVSPAIVPYVGLFSGTAPTDSSGGTECTGTNYGRIITTAKWATPSAGSVANNATISFAVASTAWAGGAMLTAFGLFNVISAGILLAWGTLTDPTKTIGIGDTASFASGALVITAD